MKSLFLHNKFAGRCLTKNDMKRLSSEEEYKKVMDMLSKWEKEGMVTKTSAIKHSNWAIRRKCNRCGAGASYIQVSECANCGSRSCSYCTKCLFLDRVKSCTSLYSFSPIMEGKDDFFMDVLPLAEAQQHTSQKLIHKYESTARHINMVLISGSGELFILSHFFAYLFLRKKRVFWCQERRKIAKTVNQLSLLMPKLSNYIEGTNRSIVLGTKWDLLTYYRQFDVIVWDGFTPEPFHAWERAVVLDGKQIIVHSTLPKWEQPDIIHPVRLHKYPLPISKFVQYRALRQHLKGNKPIIPLSLFVEETQALNGQAWILVPSKEEVRQVLKWMEKVMPDIANKTCSIYEENEEAEEIRILFAEQKFTFLLMPQQLAENMRISNLHLCLLHADHPLFDRKRLVDLTHFIGLNSYFPECEVWFIGQANTEMINQAKKEHIYLNQLAKKEGYLQKEE